MLGLVGTLQLLEKSIAQLNHGSRRRLLFFITSSRPRRITSHLAGQFTSRRDDPMRALVSRVMCAWIPVVQLGCFLHA
jgi:hypothetical protein